MVGEFRLKVWGSRVNGSIRMRTSLYQSVNSKNGAVDHAAAVRSVRERSELDAMDLSSFDMVLGLWLKALKLGVQSERVLWEMSG